MLAIKPELITDLARVIKAGITTLEPHAGPTGPGPFAGTYDWHSCVHAHWALLAMERFGAPADDWLHARLSSAVLAAEFDYLQENPAFERPYGRAWLLLLINELKRQGRTDATLEGLNSQLHTELFDYLKTHPFPEHPERDYPYLATHHSWMFTHWMCTLSAQLNDDATGAYQALYQSHICPAFDDLWQHNPVPNDFLDLGVMADLEILLWEDLEPSEIIFSAVPDAVDSTNAHMIGRLFQELWAQASYNPASIQSRFDALIQQEHLWKVNFRHASHFVPQFAWMAVYLSERPTRNKTT